MISQKCNDIFQKSIADYHIRDDVNAPVLNPYPDFTLDHLFYQKNWIDTMQWHLEDIIRNPLIDSHEALKIKRRIDESNQRRSDLVEYIDSWFLQQYKDVQPLPEARINTESPAWAVDRLSILALKIYHMEIEQNREDASKEHRENCAKKLGILIVQRQDLSQAIDQLIDDIAHGRKYMKVYRQMKMYNDAALNPVLYHQKSKSL